MEFIREGHSQAAIDGCYVCPMCRHQCTVLKATRLETDSPRSKALSLYALQRGLLAWEGSGVVEQMYRCCGCRLCTAWCASRFEPAEMVRSARAEIAQRLLAPKRAVGLLEGMEAEGNPMGLPREQRSWVLQGLGGGGRAEVVWYLGCVASYRGEAEVRSTARLLRAAGVAWTTLGEEGCCGALAWSLGFRQEAREMAARVLEGVESSGCGTVVTGCPTCYQAIAREYERWGLRPRGEVEVLHISQYLARLVREGRLALSRRVTGRAVYHDPCSLGRGMGVYGEPRGLLRSMPGLELVESRHEGERGECCGHGGGMGHVEPEVAARAARQTLEGKLQTGADMLVTACPTCRIAFERARSELGSPVEVVDLAVLAARALEASS